VPEIARGAVSDACRFLIWTEEGSMGNRQVCILIRARVMPVGSSVLSVRRVTGFRQRRVCVALHDGGTGRAESGRLREIARRALLSVRGDRRALLGAESRGVTGC